MLSVVIVTWNAKKYVRECLQSLAEQEQDLGLEIIVVDNASSDGTPELVAEQFPEVGLIRNSENLGFAKGNNVGMNLSHGEYIALINSDVNVQRDCLRKMADYLQQNPSVGMLGPRMLRPDGSVGRSYMRFPSLANWFCRALALDSLFRRRRWFGGFLMTDFDHRKTAEVDVLNGWFWMIRRSAWLQVGPLDEGFFMYGEDIDWCQRFHQAGWRVVYFPGAEALHYGGASSSVAPVRFSVEMQRANLRYYAKSHPRRMQRLAFWFLTGLHHAIRLAGYSLLFLLKRSRRTEAAFKMARSKSCLQWLMGIRTTSH